MDENKKAREKGSAILRLGAGAYLLYLVYGLVGDMMSGGTLPVFLVGLITVVFFVIGVLLIFTSCRYLWKNRNL